MKRAIASAFSALTFASIANLAHAGLVTNGGFEAGDLTGWLQTGDTINSDVEVGFPHSGGYDFTMGTFNTTFSSISQTLTTVAGANYNLTFWFAGAGDRDSAFQAIVGSNTLFSVASPKFDLDYLKYSYNFTAQSSSTVLKFQYFDQQTFMNLDDIDVLRIPEPGSAALILAGLLGLAVIHAPKRKARPFA